MLSPYEVTRHCICLGTPGAAAYVGLSVEEFLEKIDSGALAPQQAVVGGALVWGRASLDRYVRPCAVVYFVGDDHHVKIGFSTDLRKRVASLQTSAPFPLKTHFSFIGTKREERELHTLFAADRIRREGEWFRFSDEIRLWISTKREADFAALPCGASS